MEIISNSNHAPSAKKVAQRKPVASTRQSRSTNETRRMARRFDLTPSELRTLIFHEVLRDHFDDRRIA